MVDGRVGDHRTNETKQVNRRSRVKVAIVVLSIAVVLCLAVLFIIFYRENIRLGGAVSEEEKQFLILDTTSYEEPESVSACRELEWCRWTSDMSELPNASAIIMDSYSREWNIRRNPNVFFVISNMESPTHYRFTPEPNVFNWTMTYRRDADIWNPYGYMKKLDEPVEVDFEAIWSVKNKTAAWLASNCDTSNGREQLIAELQKAGLQIDRWGDCGAPVPNCGRDKLYNRCVIDLIIPYKFYMAIENSNCKDYVTEKFYHTMRDRLTVPVVIKRSIYEDLGIPGDSFIALDDYKNVTEMADHINEIAENKTAYLAYHKWRTEYQVITDYKEQITSFCAMCHKLRAGEHKSYPNVQAWHSDGICDNDYTFKFLSNN